jgi:very-short-patch-repair endonuclease
MDMTLFRRQGGVASVAALRSRGTTDNQMRWAVRRGLLARIRHGWLQTEDADPAVVAAIAAGGRLGCLSALEHHGIWVPEHDALHIALPRHAGRHRSGGLVAHWESSRWRDRHSPIESIDDVIRQVILCTDRETAISVIDSALHRGKLSTGRLARILATLPLAYATLAAETDGASESGYESLCRYRLARFGVPLHTQVELTGIGRVDLLLGDRLIVEADGWEWHEGRDAFLIDRSRDLAALRQDYLTVRLAPHHVLYEWPWVEQVIGAIIERGDHLWSASRLRRRLNNGFGG